MELAVKLAPKIDPIDGFHFWNKFPKFTTLKYNTYQDGQFLKKNFLYMHWYTPSKHVKFDE